MPAPLRCRRRAGHADREDRLITVPAPCCVTVKEESGDGDGSMRWVLAVLRHSVIHGPLPDPAADGIIRRRWSGGPGAAGGAVTPWTQLPVDRWRRWAEL
jgi:hypothetical protein